MTLFENGIITKLIEVVVITFAEGRIYYFFFFLVVVGGLGYLAFRLTQIPSKRAATIDGSCK